MKLLISLSIAAIIASSAALAGTQDYLDGYYAGFKIGYQRAHGSAIAAPMAPMPHLNSGGQNTYDQGYADGVIEGSNR